jgi:hypothetical protein
MLLAILLVPSRLQRIISHYGILGFLHEARTDLAMFFA